MSQGICRVNNRKRINNLTLMRVSNSARLRIEVSVVPYPSQRLKIDPLHRSLRERASDSAAASCQVPGKTGIFLRHSA
jgi:hypothetical protein